MSALQLADNRYLSALLESWPASEISEACLRSLGYPVSMVTSHVEAKQVLQWLEDQIPF